MFGVSVFVQNQFHFYCYQRKAEQERRKGQVGMKTSARHRFMQLQGQFDLSGNPSGSRSNASLNLKAARAVYS